jgi:2'-5' RNA ligase
MVDVLRDTSIDNGVMIAFLPSQDSAEYSTLEVPHMTLVYAGQRDDLSPNDYSALAKDAAAISMFTPPFTLVTTGVDIFGDDTERVKVLKFRPTPELLAMRRFVEHWNKSEHPFTPHSTIGPFNTDLAFVPRAVFFDKITMGWGKEYLTFSLR